ncbi:MAG: hypothetical protein ACE14L_07950 [Terriglobales bacterium]
MKALILTSLLLAFAVAAQAQQPAAPETSPQVEALQQQVKELQERLIALEGQVRMLKAQAAPPAPAAAQAPATPPAATGPAAPGVAVGQATRLGGAASLAKALNPDISMIGNFFGSIGGNSPPPGASQRTFPSLEMHESELGLQAVIDPYARGDFFLSFGEEGVGLEEGYITFTALPAGFVGRVGKMRAAFGKVNTMHTHMLPWTDRPLMTDNLVAGEEGISDAGVSLTRSFAGPKDLFLEATGQVFRGDSGDERHPLFTASRRSDVSMVAHLRGYKDITESTNLDIGVSFARGHNELGSNFLTKLYGVDATLRWKPLRRSIYRSFLARSEFVWSQRQQEELTRRAFGFYASADYQFSRRWFIGARYDTSDRAGVAGTDHGTSAALSFWPSEFSQLRWQYRSTRFAEGRNANELLMQVQFVLGAHGAHPF